jgi:hypothetical protein
MRRLAGGTLAGLTVAVSWRAAVAWLADVAATAVAAVAALTRASGRTGSGQLECRATRKYQALLTLPSAGGGDAQAPLPWPAMRAVVRARDHSTREGRLLSALVTTEDGPGQAGISHVIATMVVIGPHPDDCLGIGDSFTLWRGTDLARGVITRRLFT